MNRGVVLPQLAQSGTFPATAGFRDGWCGLNQLRKVLAGIGGDGFVIALAGETGGQTFGQLMFCKRPLSPAASRKASLFVGLRYAPASSKTGPAGSKKHQSHFAPAPTFFHFFVALNDYFRYSAYS
jgi:hypothetical protein